MNIVLSIIGQSLYIGWYVPKKAVRINNMQQGDVQCTMYDISKILQKYFVVLETVQDFLRLRRSAGNIVLETQREIVGGGC